jgi:hypothetical protein
VKLGNGGVVLKTVLSTLVTITLFGAGVWAKQATAPSSPGATNSNTNPSLPATQQRGTVNGTTDVYPSQSDPSRSDTMGVNPRNRNTSPQPSVPRDTVRPYDSTVRPYDSTIRPYDSTTNPASDTIDDTDTRRPGGLAVPDPSAQARDNGITQKIRNELLSRDLSETAKSLTVVTSGGVVTLRGEVTSENEKSAVINMAKSIADGVINEIVVRPLNGSQRSSTRGADSKASRS